MGETGVVGHERRRGRGRARRLPGDGPLPRRRAPVRIEDGRALLTGPPSPSECGRRRARRIRRTPGPFAARLRVSAAALAAVTAAPATPGQRVPALPLGMASQVVGRPLPLPLSPLRARGGAVPPADAGSSRWRDSGRARGVGRSLGRAGGPRSAPTRAGRPQRPARRHRHRTSERRTDARSRTRRSAVCPAAAARPSPLRAADLSAGRARSAPGQRQIGADHDPDRADPEVCGDADRVRDRAGERVPDRQHRHRDEPVERGDARELLGRDLPLQRRSRRSRSRTRTRSRRARRRRRSRRTARPPPASEPAPGSVSPNAASFFPDARSGSQRRFCSSLPK